MRAPSAADARRGTETRSESRKGGGGRKTKRCREFGGLSLAVQCLDGSSLTQTQGPPRREVEKSSLGGRVQRRTFWPIATRVMSPVAVDNDNFPSVRCFCKKMRGNWVVVGGRQQFRRAAKTDCWLVYRCSDEAGRVAAKWAAEESAVQVGCEMRAGSSM